MARRRLPERLSDVEDELERVKAELARLEQANRDADALFAADGPLGASEAEGAAYHGSGRRARGSLGEEGAVGRAAGRVADRGISAAGPVGQLLRGIGPAGRVAGGVLGLSLLAPAAVEGVGQALEAFGIEGAGAAATEIQSTLQELLPIQRVSDVVQGGVHAGQRFLEFAGGGTGLTGEQLRALQARRADSLRRSRIARTAVQARRARRTAEVIAGAVGEAVGGGGGAAGGAERRTLGTGIRSQLISRAEALGFGEEAEAVVEGVESVVGFFERGVRNLRQAFFTDEAISPPKKDKTDRMAAAHGGGR